MGWPRRWLARGPWWLVRWGSARRLLEDETDEAVEDVEVLALPWRFSPSPRYFLEACEPALLPTLLPTLPAALPAELAWPWLALALALEPRALALWWLLPRLSTSRRGSSGRVASRSCAMSATGARSPRGPPGLSPRGALGGALSCARFAERAASDARVGASEACGTADGARQRESGPNQQQETALGGEINIMDWVGLPMPSTHGEQPTGANAIGILKPASNEHTVVRACLRSVRSPTGSAATTSASSPEGDGVASAGELFRRAGERRAHNHVVDARGRLVDAHNVVLRSAFELHFDRPAPSSARKRENEALAMRKPEPSSTYRSGPFQQRCPFEKIILEWSTLAGASPLPSVDPQRSHLPSRVLVCLTSLKAQNLYLYFCSDMTASQ